MLPPLIRRSRNIAPQRSRERGVTMALVALSMVAIIAMAGLSIDVGTLYEASTEAQRAADAAALAAARTISMQGLTGDPTNVSSSWPQVCTLATQMAQAVASQDTVGGIAPSSVTVTFSSGDQKSNCASTGAVSFGINPTVTVQVTQTNLPIFFARVFSLVSNNNYSNATVGATATAEVFNPSNWASYNGGSVIPVQPRCVKPWIVPNLDPNGGTSCTTGCPQFVNPSNGSLIRGGISVIPPGGVIGERFWLMPDCTNPATGTACTPRNAAPEANYPNGGTGGTDPTAPVRPNLEYLPGQIPSTLTAVPACASSAPYAEAIAGCDQSTQYQCGVQSSNTGPNFVDLSENPGLTDTTVGVQCLIHQSGTSTTLPNGQDVLLPTGTGLGALPPSYPFQIQAGTSSLLTSAAGDVITSSNSIASLPIYDSSQGTTFTVGTTAPVTIVGFLQVFVNVVDGNGNMYVTVLNVSGCGNGLTTPVSTQPVFGTSPVPVRLITPPPPSS
ncbi:MAG: pilus assembly protein TadG-related protein [Candidatus Sulfotelmatobacter sp.]